MWEINFTCSLNSGDMGQLGNREGIKWAEICLNPSKRCSSTAASISLLLVHVKWDLLFNTRPNCEQAVNFTQCTLSNGSSGGWDKVWGKCQTARGKPALPHLGKAIFRGKTGQSEARSAFMFPGNLWGVVSWPIPTPWQMDNGESLVPTGTKSIQHF